MEDDHVDRPGVEAQQCVKLTGPNSSIRLEKRTMHSRKSAPDYDLMIQLPFAGVLLFNTKICEWCAFVGALFD